MIHENGYIDPRFLDTIPIPCQPDTQTATGMTKQRSERPHKASERLFYVTRISLPGQIVGQTHRVERLAGLIPEMQAVGRPPVLGVAQNAHDFANRASRAPKPR